MICTCTGTELTGTFKSVPKTRRKKKGKEIFHLITSLTFYRGQVHLKKIDVSLTSMIWQTQQEAETISFRFINLNNSIPLCCIVIFVLLKWSTNTKINHCLKRLKIKNVCSLRTDSFETNPEVKPIIMYRNTTVEVRSATSSTTYRMALNDVIRCIRNS